MLRGCRVFRFRMKCGSMYVDYKIMSRNHRRSIRVEDALVDPLLPTTVVPLCWLEQLRSPSTRLVTGYYTEEAVYARPSYGDRVTQTSASSSSSSVAVTKAPGSTEKANAIRAGPIVLYITGQCIPVVVNPLFVQPDAWGLSRPNGELDLRVGMDAIEQCSLYAELRPGGLLYSKLPHGSLAEAMEPVQETLKRYGLRCGLAESPLVPRPWTRMRYMFIDELQRGPKMTEFVGYNPRSGTQWRFSQHTKYFRTGIWRETIRRNEMNDGLHAHSSWQKSPQQAVPEMFVLRRTPLCIIPFTKYGWRLAQLGSEGSQRRCFIAPANVWRQQPTSPPQNRRRVKRGGVGSAATFSPAQNLLSPYGPVLQGPSHGPQGLFPEPLDSWLAALADSVPFYKDCLVICRSTLSQVQVRDVWQRCRQHIPTAHVGALMPRRYVASKAADAVSAQGLLPLPTQHSTGREAADLSVTQSPVPQVSCSSSIPRNDLTSASTTQLPSLYSPLEDVPPSSLDLVVLTGNVFAREMLFDAPWHLSLAHRALRPHGVIAIFGHAAEAEVAAPEWAAADTGDYITSMHQDAREALQLALREPCTDDGHAHHLRRAVEVHETLRSAHADVFFPFSSVRRRLFTSEYALWPAQLAAYYRADALYQALYSPAGSLWWRKLVFTAAALQQQQMAASSSWGNEEDFFVDIPIDSPERSDDQVQGTGRPLDDLMASWSPLGVRRRRTGRDPLEVLQSLLELHAAARRLSVSEPPLRVRLNHFVVTCSARSINATLSSSGNTRLCGSRYPALG